MLNRRMINKHFLLVGLLLLAVAGLPAWSAEPAAAPGNSHSVHPAADPGTGAHAGAVEAHGHDAHAEGHGGHKHPPEPPDLFLVVQEHYTTGTLSEIIGIIRVPFYSFLVAALILWLFAHVARNLQKIPGRLQSTIEILVETLDDFVCAILGKDIGRRYLPLLGTVAVYIWVMNLFALIPGMMSPTAVVYQTFGLSITIFFVVQFTAIKHQGVMGYLFHLANEPRDVLGYILAPLFFPLHVVSELIKPVSLGLRLWGNILGEGILMGVFSGLGLMVTPFLIGLFGIHVENPWFGIPIQVPLLFLVLMGSTIQALVFLSLSTIYISLVLPHHEHHEEEDRAGHATHPAPEGAH
ncbi:MAG: hypothetical protein AMXMBFR75_07160 [Candidatus Hinthialibacteria bacterium]